jgi:hypothetical protein
MQKLRNEESERDIRGVEVILPKTQGDLAVGAHKSRGMQLSVFRVIERSYISFRQFMLPYSARSEQMFHLIPEMFRW